MISLARGPHHLAAPWISQHYGPCGDDGEIADSVYSFCSQQSSTNLTASDLPGAGRTLGLLYSRWGRALEVSLGRIAHRSGFGPEAVASRIERTTFEGIWINGSKPEKDGGVQRVIHWSVTDGNGEKLRADCQRLVAYSTSDVQQTRIQALQQIIRLITGQPRLRAFFNTPSNLITLRSAAQPSSISRCSSSSRESELRDHLETRFFAKKAMLIVEDNSMNAVVDDILQLPFVRRDKTLTFSRQYINTMMKLLEFCGDPHFSFVAKRHLCSALNYLPWNAVCQFSPALLVFLQRAITQVIDSHRPAAALYDGVSPFDLDGTERLAEVLLLPRCRGVHTLDRELHFVRPWALSDNCRCTKNASVNEEMRCLLLLLQNPTARKFFPRASAIAQDIWHPSTDG